MVKVKICGLTHVDDALAAAGFGADALGFIFAESPRKVAPDRARTIVEKLPPFVLRVGVFVNEDLEEIQDIKRYCGLDAVQLHRPVDARIVATLGGRVIQAVKVKGPDSEWEACPEATLLLDAYVPGMEGGTGQTFDWNLAIEPARRRTVILAGGLNPDNVSQAAATVRPYAVDVASGVESEPGRKSHEKLERFIRSAKSI